MSITSKNPLDYVTVEDLLELGLSIEEIEDGYQPSGGGVFHARGVESQGKTLWIAHYFRYLIDNKIYSTNDAVGNMTFKGRYSIGYQTLKGDNLRQYLWDLTHKPYQHKIVIIDEADSEFPARLFTDKEQTEISLRLWHTAKLHNTVLMSSHAGNSTDLIMHLASHYLVYPRQPSFETNTLEFTIANILDLIVSDWIAYDVIRTMLIYNRRELTEDTEAEQGKIRPSQKTQRKKRQDAESLELLDLDIERELINL